MAFRSSFYFAPVLGAVIVMLSPSDAAAQVLYCCYGDKNIRHCSDSLPRQCIGRAYTVRGGGGRLIREVSAPLTPEQWKAKEILDEKRRQDEIARKEQALVDAALLATYGSVAEIDRSRARTEKEIDEGIALTQKKLTVAEAKLHALTDPNIIKERLSPEDFKHKSGELEREIASLKEVLDRKVSEKAGQLNKYTEDKRRYIEIRSRAPTR